MNFKVGDKVKRVRGIDKMYVATSGEVVTISRIEDDCLVFGESDAGAVWGAEFYELVESAEDAQTKEEVKGQEVTLSFKGDSLKVNLKATNPEDYYCNEDELLLAMQKIMQIAKNWNTFSLTIEAEDKDNY